MLVSNKSLVPVLQGLDLHCLNTRPYRKSRSKLSKIPRFFFLAHDLIAPGFHHPILLAPTLNIKPTLATPHLSGH